MSLLNREEIIALRDMGHITIEPFHEKNIGTAQYDVTLGEFFYRESVSSKKPPVIYNPYCEESVRAGWALCQAERLQWRMSGIKEDDKVILISPGETILGHTNEFIGGSSNFITTMMKARSSMGRNNIEVCKCAGMGDVGFFNRWTMEITNNSQDRTIPLVVGRRIAQILFFKVRTVDGGIYSDGGKYQVSSTLKELQAKWTPDEMLPKQWLDREVVE